MGAGSVYQLGTDVWYLVLHLQTLCPYISNPTFDMILSLCFAFLLAFELVLVTISPQHCLIIIS